MFKKHGYSHTRLYKIWKSMRNRCLCETHPAYKNYGGRGISICEEWNDFKNFHDWAFANGYDENARYMESTLDRIDVNGNYEPSNCRFVGWNTQSHNKRNVKKYEYNGIFYTIPELAELSGKSRDLLYDRIVRYKWDLAKAVEEDVRTHIDPQSKEFEQYYNLYTKGKISLRKMCAEIGVCFTTLKHMIEQFEMGYGGIDI